MKCRLIILRCVYRSETAGGPVGGKRRWQHDQRRERRERGERSERRERREWRERRRRARHGALLGRQAAAPGRGVLAAGVGAAPAPRPPGARAPLAGPGARAAPRPRLRRVAGRPRPPRLTPPGPIDLTN